jgi:hypothetical protein
MSRVQELLDHCGIKIYTSYPDEWELVGPKRRAILAEHEAFRQDFRESFPVGLLLPHEDVVAFAQYLIHGCPLSLAAAALDVLAKVSCESLIAVHQQPGVQAYLGRMLTFEQGILFGRDLAKLEEEEKRLDKVFEGLQLKGQE